MRSSSSRASTIIIKLIEWGGSSSSIWPSFRQRVSSSSSAKIAANKLRVQNGIWRPLVASGCDSGMLICWLYKHGEFLWNFGVFVVISTARKWSRAQNQYSVHAACNIVLKFLKIYGLLVSIWTWVSVHKNLCRVTSGKQGWSGVSIPKIPQ